ncbi:MAG: hypothetical protein CMN58_00205 [Solibacterales bacterium]|nr:hypothetical protein [Bryobacterales bacterium]|tara:strand:- start:1764 stop:3563 length:1800 start_codon:yes stop_codon:yes gene_type:complete
MLKSRFFWKLSAGYFVLVLAVSLIIGLTLHTAVERGSYEELRRSLKAQAILVKQALKSSDITAESLGTVFQKYVRDLDPKLGVHITLIRADGVVVADSGHDVATMGNYSDYPEILATHTHEYGFATRQGKISKNRTMYLALAVRDKGHPLGYIRIGLPLELVDLQLTRFQTGMIRSIGVSIILALLLAFVVTRHFVKPLVSMTSVADSISQGNYERKVLATRKDEIGHLAHALNKVSESSRERTHAIGADRKKLAAILSGMTEGVIAISNDERVVHLNDAAGRLLGATPGESVDKPIWQVTRLREVSEILGDVLRDGAELQRNLQIATAASDQFIEMHASPLHDGEGVLVGAVAVLHDLSELHRLDMVRREFVANASHELKTPITAIRGLVETLIDDSTLTASTRERFLGKIKDQSMRLSSIVVDLLALSRLESRGSNKEETSFDLRDVVQAIANNFVPLGEEKGIVVNTELNSQSIEITADKNAIGQAVSNLLDNALKYTPRGGRITARLSVQDGEVVVEVEDTGIGVEPQDRDRIFERFYRVDKARSRELGGTGLGLAIVKHIAFVHGGRVAVDSTPGAGSTFSIFLPLARTSNRSN